MEQIKEKLEKFLKKTNFSLLKKSIIFNLLKSSIENFEAFEKADVWISFYSLGKRDCLKISISNHIPFEKIKGEWNKKGKALKFHYFYKFVDKITLKENGRTYLNLFFYL